MSIFILTSFSLIFLCWVGVPAVGRADQSAPVTSPSQDAIVSAEQSDILSADLGARERAFEKITAPLRRHRGFGEIDPSLATEATKRAVTALFGAEFRPDVKDSPTDTASQPDDSQENAEALDSYISALTDAVQRLHDPASIPLLYKPEVLMSGRMATSALGYFGHTEAGRIVALFKQERRQDYKGALEMTIFSMLQRNNIDDPILRNEVEALLLKQSYSPRSYERSMATTGLSFYRDEVARSRLSVLAATDPFQMVTFLDHKRIYVVRERAAIALRGPEDTGDLK